MLWFLTRSQPLKITQFKFLSCFKNLEFKERRDCTKNNCTAYFVFDYVKQEVLKDMAQIHFIDSLKIYSYMKFILGIFMLKLRKRKNNKSYDRDRN